MGTPSIVTLGKLAVDDSAVTQLSDFDGNSFAYEYLPGTDLRKVRSQIYNDGIRGTRSRSKERCREGTSVITGSIIMNPTPVELDQWLPRILGAAESTDTFALAETVPEWGVLMEKTTQRHVYTGCRVERATFRGSQGGLIELRVDAEGETEVLTATSFPGTVPAIDDKAPYFFADTTFQLSADTSAAEVMEWEIIIQNFLTTDRFMNSSTRTQLVATDRLITVSMTVPYTADEIDLYSQTVAGAAGTLTLTNGGVSTLFSFANLKCPTETPTEPAKGERFLKLDMTAYKSASTNELIVTHDSAP